MSHQAPGVLEGDFVAWLKELVNVGTLAIVARDTKGVTEGLFGSLKVCKLIHYYFL